MWLPDDLFQRFSNEHLEALQLEAMLLTRAMIAMGFECLLLADTEVAEDVAQDVVCVDFAQDGGDLVQSVS